MADVTKAEMAVQVLGRLLVIAAGETPATADSDLAEAELDKFWARFSKFELAPFDIDLIPDEAQPQVRDYVAYKLAPTFGVTGQRLMELKDASRDAELDLARQFSVPRQNDDITIGSYY